MSDFGVKKPVILSGILFDARYAYSGVHMTITLDP